MVGHTDPSDFTLAFRRTSFFSWTSRPFFFLAAFSAGVIDFFWTFFSIFFIRLSMAAPGTDPELFNFTSLVPGQGGR